MDTVEQTNVQQEAASFFRPLANTLPFLKLAAQGFAGSGKTYTLALLAIGLHRRIGSTKPVVFFDTEQSSKFLKQLFATAGISVLVKESRSLADLAATMNLCAKGASDVLMTDSISHVWEDYLEAYKQKVKRTRLQFEDWGVLKPTWKREFSDRLVNLPVHVLFTGRAGYEYSDEKDDQGKRQIFKSGVKMKVEGETAYEPDLLLNMERFEEILPDQDKVVYRLCTVLKDRSGLTDGKTFQNPTYDHFAPVVEYLLANPVTATNAPAADTKSLFETSDDGERQRTERAVLLEELEGMMVQAAPGQTAKEKAWKVAVLERLFATRSWRAVTMAPLDKLRVGKARMQAIVTRNLELKQAAEADGKTYEPTLEEPQAPAQPHGVAAALFAPPATSTTSGHGADQAQADAALRAATPDSEVTAGDGGAPVSTPAPGVQAAGESPQPTASPAPHPPAEPAAASGPEPDREEWKERARKALDKLGITDNARMVKKAEAILGHKIAGPLTGHDWQKVATSLEAESGEPQAANT